MVKYVIEKSGSHNQIKQILGSKDGNYALVKAAKNNYCSIVKYLVNNGANIAFLTQKQKKQYNLI